MSMVSNTVNLADGGGGGKPKTTTTPPKSTPKTSSSSSGSSSSSMQSYGSLKVGDKVQIKGGGIDVTNGVKATAGRLYGEGGPRWGTIVGIYDNWSTGSRWGLPAKVVKVRIQGDDGKTIVWQVQPQDVAGQTITPTEVKKDPAPAPDPLPPQPTPKEASLKETFGNVYIPEVEIPASNAPFSPDGNSDKWYTGNESTASAVPAELRAENIKVGYISESMFDNSSQSPSYKRITGAAGTKLYDTSDIRNYLISLGYSSSEISQILATAKKNSASKSVLAGSVYRAEYQSSWSSEGRRKELLNADASRIQNDYKFPFVSTSATGVKKSESKIAAAKYDYQFIPSDPRLPKNSPIKDLEDRLMEVRASFGIPVHGNNDIARSMKMYMYNRFKSPDMNLAHNKSVTHVFFTRPDLNLLDSASKPAKQVMNHTDTALLWRTKPELFKLLTAWQRCGDGDNLNLLLSNQVTSFSLDDEKLATVRAGKSWAEHEMVYGEQYTGRTAGEFTCTFTETSEYSIINLMKLWITYIDNVSRGAWSPWYPHDASGNVLNRPDENCHAFARALDYAASVYIFKCGPDGEEILYWSKYYGVFPTVTGSSALSWELGSPIGDAPKLNINFAYSFKKDLSPISLLEFNHVANATEDMIWVPSFDDENAHCFRPYVGSPYIEIDLGTPNLGSSDVDKDSKKTQLRLKFRPDTSKARTDALLFKANK